MGANANKRGAIVTMNKIAIRYIDGAGNTHDIPANAVITFTTTSGEIQANIKCGRLRIITMDGAMDIHPNS